MRQKYHKTLSVPKHTEEGGGRPVDPLNPDGVGVGAGLEPGQGGVHLLPVNGGLGGRADLVGRHHRVTG